MIFERPDIIRPPSEADSYFLPLTSGCSNNSCVFCNYYGYKLNLRALEDIKKEIDALALYMNSGLTVPGMPSIVYSIARHWDGRRVFLQDADALVYPNDHLKEALEYFNRKLPGTERIGSYGTPQDILRTGVNELTNLKKSKLSIIYMGVESGDDAILKYIDKGVDSRQMIEAGRRIKEAGILLSVTVLLGLGERKKSLEHALATARVLSEMDPDYIGALTLTLIPGTPLFEANRRGEFNLISPLESLKELRTMLSNIRATNCFFSSMHASNYFSVRGTIPRDQAKMVAQLDHIISLDDPSLLRPEFMRGL
ncbi:MAG: radical SAM protein [Dehalococcoidales bacterium]|nr:radical SAM protein [Dehalococcoidales bacterium]